MKSEELKSLNLQSLNLSDRLVNSEQFNLHPQVIFESNFVSVGSDIEKAAQTKKFNKRLNVLMKDMNDLHVLRSKVLETLKGFKCPFVIVSSNHGYPVIAQQYAQLNKALKAYTKFMAAQKKKGNTEIEELGVEFEDLNELNVFTMMLEDLDAFKSLVGVRIQEHKEKYPTFVPKSEVSEEIDFEVVKQAFKSV